MCNGADSKRQWPGIKLVRRLLKGGGIPLRWDGQRHTEAINLTDETSNTEKNNRAELTEIS